MSAHLETVKSESLELLRNITMCGDCRDDVLRLLSALGETELVQDYLSFEVLKEWEVCA